jgi:hypothetical protein
LGKNVPVNTQGPEKEPIITKTILIPDAYNGTEPWITLIQPYKAIHLFVTTLYEFLDLKGEPGNHERFWKKPLSPK